MLSRLVQFKFEHRVEDEERAGSGNERGEERVGMKRVGKRMNKERGGRNLHEG